MQTEKLQIEKEREMREAPWRQKKKKRKEENKYFLRPFWLCIPKIPMPHFSWGKKGISAIVCLFFIHDPSVTFSRSPMSPATHRHENTKHLYRRFFFQKTRDVIVYFVLVNKIYDVIFN